MHAVVTGMIATYPVGGVVWDYGQYLVGLEELGMDVWYLEDTGGDTFDPRSGQYGPDPSFGVGYLQRSLSALSPSLGDRWHFVDSTGGAHGVPQGEFAEIVESADVFLNVSGSTLLREPYLRSKCKVLIDTDPGWNHFVNYPAWDREPGWQGSAGYRSHDIFFTYAERLGRVDCRLPDLGLRWMPTRPPVVLNEWCAEGTGTAWTTVMTWNNFRREIAADGEVYGTKELEFPKVDMLPTLLPSSDFELAVGGTGGEPERWRSLGWSVVDSVSVSKTAEDYRDYVQRSRGEFSVAKNVYVATRSGWFSCRTVCYLASGRPAVVQDTGFSDVVPCGEGLLSFDDLQSAMHAIEVVEADYEAHCEAARAIAVEQFASDVVLGRLLEQAGVL